ncbi:hypothetical protein Taro_030280 [Colocasia esculenta]|uniref:Uncharacterized protein n=1 Tax=Colocasia esculenta TaxID=4460 RepID=A0A843VXG5_COLES|nr:hypothetical protein [Colocasia esculenta]
MGVPGNGNNLSHGTSPQVPRTGRTTKGDTGYVTFRPVRGSGNSSSENLPETGETLHTGEGSMLIMLENY